MDRSPATSLTGRDRHEHDRTAGWDYDVAGFISAHPHHVIRGHADGYRAQRKAHGRATGPLLKSLSLDELAAKIEAQLS